MSDHESTCDTTKLSPEEVRLVLKAIEDIEREEAAALERKQLDRDGDRQAA